MLHALTRHQGEPGHADRPAGYAVHRLALTDFRSYARLRLDVDARPVVLFGANGAGKTNVLEAISFLAPGRGLRRSRLTDVARRGASTGWAVAAEVVGPDGVPADIGTGTVGETDAASGRRAVRIDESAQRGPASLAEVLTLVWLTPQMDRLFQDDATARRRFLDRLVFGYDPLHARRVAAYERALRQRARLLRTGNANPGWLAALEETMAEYGIAVAAARRELVARLEGGLAQGVGPFPRAAIAVDGTVENWLDGMAAVDAEFAFRAALAESRSRDAESGGAAVGPHRSDMAVQHLANDLPAPLCSTGEQKALLISIVLADARLKAARRRAAPLLLLDEVVAHLDGERRTALFDEILALGAQAWLTGTDRDAFSPLGDAAQFLAVDGGCISYAG